MLLSMSETATGRPGSGYALGSSEAEHEQLIKQAARFLPLTERLFRDAGVGPGSVCWSLAVVWQMWRC
jgi:hypothetical protein